jgi:cytochrome bd-type quinol oxidase subunit 2
MTAIDWTFHVAQTANLLILVGWLVLAIVALMRLRHCQLDEIARALWVIIVVLMPFVGALVFFIVRPGSPRPGKQRWTRPK